MHHSYLDKYARADSPLHRLDARIKLLLVLGLVILVAQVHPPGVIFVLALISLIVLMGLVARIPMDYLMLRSAVVLPFSGAAAISLAFTFGDSLALTEPGLHRAAALLLRSWIAVCFMILLINTTPFDRLLHALRSLKVPGVFVLLLSFLYRYLYLLWDELERMQRARNLRYFGGRWRNQAGLLGMLAAALFLRSYERAERVQMAMISRGWTGELATSGTAGLRRKDIMVLVTGGLLIIALWIIRGH
jgi:cobalt/nickel transport system permease protein